MKHGDCQRNIIAATMWPRHSKRIIRHTIQAEMNYIFLNYTETVIIMAVIMSP